MRGELEQVEQQVATWCSKSNSEYALSRFSAAWRLAPEVRYEDSILIDEIRINALRGIDLAFEASELITIEGRMPDGSVNQVTARLVAPEIARWELSVKLALHLIC